MTLLAERPTTAEEPEPKRASGLLAFREPGFEVLTRRQLRSELNAHPLGTAVAAWETESDAENDEFIYAVFHTTADPGWDGQHR